MSKSLIRLPSNANERSLLKIVFIENEAESGRTGSSEEDDMKYRREAVAEKGWYGEFRTYEEWARLGPQPSYRSATFPDGRGRPCITQQDFVRARDDGAFPLRYRWEATEARKRR